MTCEFIHAQTFLYSMTTMRLAFATAEMITGTVEIITLLAE